MQTGPRGARDDEHGVVKEATTNPQRRRILAVLRDANAPMGLADLALELARRDGESSEADVWTRAEDYRIDLYHNHVPRLEAAGLVAYDDDRRSVELATDGPVRPPVDEMIAGTNL